MSAFAKSDEQKSAHAIPAAARGNVTWMIETLVILSLQLVFRATPLKLLADLAPRDNLCWI